jgi:hypothetical protein
VFLGYCSLQTGLKFGLLIRPVTAHCHQPWSKATNSRCSVVAHFQMGQGGVLLSFLPIKAVNITFITISNLSPFRFPRTQPRKLLTLRWHSFLGSGRERIPYSFLSTGCQSVQKWQRCMNISLMHYIEGYLNATINRKPKMQNQRLEPTCLAKPSVTRGLRGMGPCVALQEAVGWVIERFGNQTKPGFWYKPRLLAGYLHQLLTLRAMSRAVYHG